MTMVLIETLMGNYVLKSPEKVKVTDMVEMEFYGDSLEEIKIMVKAHKKDLK